jgi:hypothetical protein
MSAPTPDYNELIDSIPGREIPPFLNILINSGMGLGVAAIAYGFTMFDVAWTWGAILVGIVYFLAIAQGGVMFSVMLTGTWGRWGRPLKRIAESFAFFLPFGYILLVGFLIWGTVIYPWNPDTILATGPVDLAPHSAAAHASKEWWLSKGFLISRQVFAFAILLTLDYFYLKASFRPDMIQAKARLGAKAPKWWDHIIKDAGDLDSEIEKGFNTQSRLFPVLTLAYVLVFSLMVMDLIMSQSPWWYANMFPAWIWMSSVWLAFATLGLVSMFTRDWLGLKDVITSKVTHDLGKLLLAFCMFWAYTCYAQILPIWYANMPEETDYLLVRLMLPTWGWLARAVAVMCFIAPFTILMSRGIKKMRWPFAAICLLIMTGLFLERSLLVMPGVYFGSTFPAHAFIIVNVGIWIGLFSVFIGIIGRALSTLPPLVTTDPYLQPHPWDHHVQSWDAHSHD